ncbi:MAG: hypothetical protein JSS36_01230 [Proteobacteria bacterium]|nr:hypothetical protein [Pseudomonadota bacterium]
MRRERGDRLVQQGAEFGVGSHHPFNIGDDLLEFWLVGEAFPEAIAQHFFNHRLPDRPLRAPRPGDLGCHGIGGRIRRWQAALDPGLRPLPPRLFGETLAKQRNQPIRLA